MQRVFVITTNKASFLEKSALVVLAKERPG